MSAIVLVGECDREMQSIADATALTLGIDGRAEVELVYCSAEEIRELNRSTRGVDKATDVLSFPTLELRPGNYIAFTADNFRYETDPDGGSVMLGSIVICDSVAAAQAEEYGHSIEREKGYLFLHGLLHLLGYDHMTDDDKAVMREAEEKILTKLGLTR